MTRTRTGRTGEDAAQTLPAGGPRAAVPRAMEHGISSCPDQTRRCQRRPARRRRACSRRRRPSSASPGDQLGAVKGTPVHCVVGPEPEDVEPAARASVHGGQRAAKDAAEGLPPAARGHPRVAVPHALWNAPLSVPRPKTSSAHRARRRRRRAGSLNVPPSGSHPPAEGAHAPPVPRLVVRGRVGPEPEDVARLGRRPAEIGRRRAREKAPPRASPSGLQVSPRRRRCRICENTHCLSRGRICRGARAPRRLRQWQLGGGLRVSSFISVRR